MPVGTLFDRSAGNQYDSKQVHSSLATNVFISPAIRPRSVQSSFFVYFSAKLLYDYFSRLCILITSCQPVHLPTCPLADLSNCRPVYLQTCLPAHLYTTSRPVHLSNCRPVYCQPVYCHLATCLTADLSTCIPPTCPHTDLPTCRYSIQGSHKNW